MNVSLPQPASGRNRPISIRAFKSHIFAMERTAEHLYALDAVEVSNLRMKTLCAFIKREDPKKIPRFSDEVSRYFGVSNIEHSHQYRKSEKERNDLARRR